MTGDGADRVTGSDDPVDMFLLEAMVHGSEKDPLDKFQIDYTNPVDERMAKRGR